MERALRIVWLREVYHRSGKDLALSVHDVVRIARRQTCTDPRDRIWAIC
jgi:hypothetical protein